MNAEQVIEKILSDAQGEAGRIRRKADEKDSAEQAQLEAQLKEYGRQTEVIAKKAGEEKKSHLLAVTRMEIARQLLAEKRKILDEVFAKAQKQLESLPDKEYQQLVIKLMLDAVETGDEEVIVDGSEKRINQQLIEEVNQQLAAKSKGNLKLSGERQNIGAGFILKSGRIKTNASVAVLLAQARKELETEIGKDFFS